MNLKPLKPYFFFTRSQRIGIFTLIAMILVLQLVNSFAIDHFVKPTPPNDDHKWMALQPVIDSLKIAKAKPQQRKIYPFNPNFISDEKGYALGMSVNEIDRLHDFRNRNKFVNSAAEFQMVTKVSDSLLMQLSPYFKFPDWVSKRNDRKIYQKFDAPKPVKVIDINLATAEELIAVYGIGPALSERILKQRDLLGGFISIDQVRDVWGISDEVVDQLEKRFKVSSQPVLKKIRINDASTSELSKFPYFRYPLSKNIVTYRSMNGKIKSADDLAKIKDFPTEKVNIIAVYLEF